jgi:hypothetical protein
MFNLYDCRSIMKCACSSHFREAFAEGHTLSEQTSSLPESMGHRGNKWSTSWLCYRESTLWQMEQDSQLSIVAAYGHDNITLGLLHNFLVSAHTFTKVSYLVRDPKESRNPSSIKLTHPPILCWYVIFGQTEHTSSSTSEKQNGWVVARIAAWVFTMLKI